MTIVPVAVLGRLGRAAAVGLVSLVLDDRCAGCDGVLGALLGPACRRCADRLARAPEPRCRRCSLPLGAIEPSGQRCPACERRPRGIEIAAPFAHRGVARGLVLACKHGRRPEIADTLARAAARDPQVARLLAGADALVPVPADPLRRRRRGFDQAELLARALARLRPLPRPRVVRALARPASPGPQAGRTGQARRRALSGAFRARALAASRLRRRRVVLVDDVVTTGASLAEARRVLLRLGVAEVAAVACTRSEQPPGGTP